MSIAALMAGAPMRVGSTNRAAVIAIQLALRAAGAELVCKGDFGPITEAAVRRFQAAHHLTVDGVVFTETAAALDALAAGAPAPSAPHELTSSLAVAPWLSVMRAITGTKELPGAADSPIILSWRDKIIEKYPDLAPGVRDYTHDSIPWCGFGLAYAMAMADVKPPKFPMYATNWFYQWHDGVRLSEPALGAVLVKTRNGGGHVTLLEGQDSDHYYCRGCNQSDMVNVARIAKRGSGILGFMAPLGFERRLPDLPHTTFAEAVAGSEA